MLSYSAWYYGDSRLQRAIFDTQGLELDALRAAVLDVLKQFYVDSASWGMERWEKELSISPPDGAGLELRRSLVRSKLLRPPTVTPRWLQEIANQFVQGKTARIIEVPGTYTFILDVPIDDILWCSEMRKAVEAMKPAHLAMYLLMKIFSEWNINQSAECTQIVDAQHSAWNLGTAEIVRYNRKYKLNRTFYWSGIYPDVLYRTRQMQYLECNLFTDNMHRIWIGIKTLATTVGNAKILHTSKIYAMGVGTAHSQQTMKVDNTVKLTNRVNCIFDSNCAPREVNLYNRGFAYDGTHTYNRSKIQSGWVENICTMIRTKKGRRVGIERV